ncbi:aldo/keto reductase [Amycolatopsis magusensis]|uniref:aldo/keto reductase n=1 Tax=Amycolatopsis magusensis TaxID=882444 RepID=UPI0024A7E16F|nr:aldo/keto reductase [Amycolatopsis magusensis]
MALGTMTFGEDWGWGAQEDESKAILHEYLSQGGNFIDTANGWIHAGSLGEEVLPRDVPR